MSKYEEQYDGSDSICPYCKHSYQVESEDYSEESQEIQCDECGKKYYLHQYFSISHHSTPDCELNGEKHQFELIGLKNGSAYFCKICDKCKLQ